MDPDTSAPQKPLSTFTPQSDSSKYIRTYAKDLAQVTNTPVPASAAEQTTSAAAVASNVPPSPIPSMAAKPEMVHEMGVSLPQVDESPVNRKGDPASPKEFEGEHLELTGADSEGIFKEKGEPAAAKAPIQQTASPFMPQASIGVQPTVAPSTETPAESTGSAGAHEENREAILTRLRAKLAHRGKEQGGTEAEGRIIEETILPKPMHAAEPQPAAPVKEPFWKPAAPAPKSSAPKAAPAPVAEPKQAATPAAAPTYREPIPAFEPLPTFVPQTPLPKAPPAPPPAPAPVAQGPSPLHTYSSDFADRIDRQNSSTFSVLAAQSDAPRTSQPVSKPRRTLVPLLAGGAMLIIGIGAVIGAYAFMTERQEVPIVAGVPSLIRYDESVEVQGTGTALMNAIADVAAGGSVSGNVIVTYVTTDANGTPTGIPQPGGVLIRALSLPAPSILLRNIEESSTVGVIDAGGEARPFFILKVSSYERTFAGMLAWEATLQNDLSNFYPEYSAFPQEIASSTASSSPSLSYAQRNTFTDAVVANHDVRILRDAAGRFLFLYGYVNKDILVIARDEAAFTALASRISASGD